MSFDVGEVPIIEVSLAKAVAEVGKEGFREISVVNAGGFAA